MPDLTATQEVLRQVRAAVSGETVRLRVVLRGAVQGVGFRPFAYRLASALGLSGWVSNGTHGVTLEVEGPRPAVETFLLRLERDAPPRASIQSVESSWLEPEGDTVFQIRESRVGGRPTAVVLPDIAPCADCLRELFDPRDRRFRHPFLNCTNCGPRCSIITALPYDRANTTMRAFMMCPACREEYDDPADRRFHAQPIACPSCGPHLELWDPSGHVVSSHEGALTSAVQAIREGRIVAVKGVGGFHLMVEADNNDAVRRLRTRKHREEKPFALMAPSLGWITARCEVSPLEGRLLRSPEAPMVLLRRTCEGVAASVAPNNPSLGVMLPSTPLHHLLMRELEFAVVATSGNRSDEPICTDEREALHRLSGIADAFLVHDRPIARHVDDSIARIMAGQEVVLRRARGYAPLPVASAEASPPLLAVGAHLKNAVAITVGTDIVLSQHIGDLDTPQSVDAFERVIGDVSALYAAHPEGVVCDAHPDYHSTQVARASGLAVRYVQHHEAHVRACMADNRLTPPVLGVAWDGTGYGTDGTVWGGEFLQVTAQSCRRVAHLRRFRLPGGEQAIKDPRRCAYGLLHEMAGTDLPAQMLDWPAGATQPRVVAQMLERGVRAPWTSSIGRLFDAVSALLGLCRANRFEGQAAMAVEWAADGVTTDAAYPMALVPCPAPHDTTAARGAAPIEHPVGHLMIDWAPMMQALLDERRCGSSVALMAAKFHNGLAEAIVSVARHAGETRLALSGGCFQNRLLTERTVQRLRQEGFRPFWHQRVPPNDGGIAVGQLAAAGGVPQQR